MVQLKEEDNSIYTPERSTYSEVSQKKWPYILLSVGCVLLSAGMYHLLGSFSGGGCPFHMFISHPYVKQHTTTPEYDPSLYSEDLVYGSRKKLADFYSGRVVTKFELAQHGGDSANLWVAVLGHVYDVSTGIRHYGQHGTYNFFTGRDGSRAYSTGTFTDEGLTDDVSGMSPAQLGEIFHWINIFSKKYPFIGRLEGPFFSGEGLPTAVWREVEIALEELAHMEEEKSALFRKFPSCNSHYDQGAGRAEVWCSDKSGGVSRSWIGVPRQLHIPGESVRCACIQDSLLSDPKLREYENCAPSSVSCKFKLS